MLTSFLYAQVAANPVDALITYTVVPSPAFLGLI